MNCELRDYSSLYLLGLLEANEFVVYEKHLLQGCDICKTEMEQLSVPVEILARAGSQVSPRPEVKLNLLAKIRAKNNDQSFGNAAPPRYEEPYPGMLVTRTNDAPWEEMGIEGITIKTLFNDPTSKTITMLVRMAAGASYPTHRHAHVEECLVLEGDLHIGDSCVMRAGDYQRAENQSLHARHWTEKGCLLYVTTSAENELLE